MSSPQRRGSRDSAEESFEEVLSGGHPNSSGRTVEVVDLVLADRDRLDELYGCYCSSDEVVRLRVSSAMKRVTGARPDWTMEYMDRLQHEIASIDQASTQWTLALLFDLTRAFAQPGAAKPGRGDHAAQPRPSQRLDRAEHLDGGSGFVGRG